MDDFTAAYIECLAWLATDENGEPCDHWLDASELTEAQLEEIERDCEDFQEANAELLEQAGSAEQNGHDFALTRNGHGAGFWDRGYGEVGEKLSEACKPYGTQALYVYEDSSLGTCIELHN